MIVYRVTKLKRATDLTGNGARLVGGRWNTPGNAMLYTASSRSLALLELLAHSTVLPNGMAMVELKLPTRFRIPIFTEKDVPFGWNDLPPSFSSQAFGDAFLKDGRSLAIRVPSVIVSGEDNILINPFHARAKEMEIVAIEELSVDPRLK